MIYSYHHFKYETPVFYTTSSNSHTCESGVLYMGAELEVDKGGESDEQSDMVITTMDNFVYCENDGSLRNGFEIITQPATLAYHVSLNDMYATMFKNLVRSGYRSHNTATCGLHIHISRSYFSNIEESEETILAIFDKFWDNLVRFSRRNLSAIERWADKYDDSPVVVVRNMGRYDRYHAVNFENANTIEFRLFKGTLNLYTFYATLELVQSIAEYAETHNYLEVANLDWENLLNTDNLKSYWDRVKNRDIS